MCFQNEMEDDRAIYLPILEYALELGFTTKTLKKAMMRTENWYFQRASSTVLY